MTPASSSAARRGASATWRIVVAVLPLAVGLPLSAMLLPSTRDPSDPVVLALRAVAGLAIGVLALGVIALLLRAADGRRMRDAGLTDFRTGWRLAVWGAVVWAVPAGVTFSVLALLGTPLTLGAPLLEVAAATLLLLLAVVLAEALPEEAVFRGYLTTVLGTVTRGWGIIVAQALLFTLFAALIRQNANPVDLSLFLAMGIGFGYLRMITGSVWMPIGFHAAFQTGSQLVLSHDVVEFAGGTGAAMLALGMVPFTAAAVLVSSVGIPRFVNPAGPGSR